MAGVAPATMDAAITLTQAAETSAEAQEMVKQVEGGTMKVHTAAKALRESATTTPPPASVVIPPTSPWNDETMEAINTLIKLRDRFSEWVNYLSQDHVRYAVNKSNLMQTLLYRDSTEGVPAILRMLKKLVAEGDSFEVAEKAMREQRGGSAIPTDDEDEEDDYDRVARVENTLLDVKIMRDDYLMGKHFIPSHDDLEVWYRTIESEQDWDEAVAIADWFYDNVTPLLVGIVSRLTPPRILGRAEEDE